MKTLPLLLLGGIVFSTFLPASVQAQVNRQRYGVRRLPPQMQAPQRGATNPPAADTNTVAVPTPPPAPNPVVRTQMYVRVVQPPPDPEKVKAAKAEALRKTVEFQKKRAEEGSESAQYELGLRYLKGEGVDKDEATGRRWLNESAKNGYGPATRKLQELDNPPKPKEPAEPKEK